MLLNFAAVAAGFVLLVWGADRFVAGAAGTARALGAAPLLVGLTIVGFGTAAPELLVAAMAALAGNPGLAIGNAIGSNITNIALCLGATALFVPLQVRGGLLRRELPLLLAVMLVAFALLADGELRRLDGAILLSGLAGFVSWLAWRGKNPRPDEPALAETEMPAELSLPRALAWLAIGLVVLLASSRLLVWGAANLAVALGVSDLVIGLTVVAIGTSLPELATSIIAARRGEHDIAIGNVLGSNIYNLLGVLGLPGLLHPGAVPREALVRDFPVMLGLTLLFLALARGGRLGWPAGALLLAGFGAYQLILYFAPTFGILP